MFEGCGLIETEGPIGKGALIFNLVKMVVSALHRELECKVEKLKYKKFEVMQPRIKKTNFQHMNKLSWISPNQVLQSWLIYTGYHKLVKNNRGKGRGVGLKKEGGSY